MAASMGLRRRDVITIRHRVATLEQVHRRAGRGLVDACRLAERGQQASALAATAMVVASPGGYVAAGNVGLGPGASLWTSTDGIAWVPVAGVGLRSGASADQLVSDARPVLLVGRDANGASLAPLSAGGSADQTAWCVLRPRRTVCCRRSCRDGPLEPDSCSDVWRRRRELNPRTRFCRPLPGPLGHVAPIASHWLPREDSNLGSRIQSPLSYH